jgi:hypothetical protein
MKISDFIKYFNLLTVVRDPGDSWYELRFERMFLPSFGCRSSKSQEWL